VRSDGGYKNSAAWLLDVLLHRLRAAISHQSNSTRHHQSLETALTIAVVIVAAGRGTRAAGATPGLPKQYVRLAGEMVLTRTLRAFAEHPAGCPLLQVVIGPDDHDLFAEATKVGFPKLLLPVIGGVTRQASVLAGLEALMPHQPGRVLIHDAARPFVSAAVIDRVLVGLTRTPGAIAAMPVADTLKRGDANGEVSATIDRAGHWAAQTPQGFQFSAILAAHRQAASSTRQSFTDDAAIAEWAGLAVSLVLGSAKNLKLTTHEDMILAEEALSRGSLGLPDVRTGTGFDVHKFAPGDAVWLCGVKIPFTHKLDGHSDADVGLHALTDAILGALGDGDIGSHFPPSDMQWKGAASHLFLTHARSLVEAKSHDHVRSAEGRSASGCDAVGHCRYSADRHRAGWRQSHHHGRVGLCWAARGHCGDGQCNAGAAGFDLTR
jgi:2-C-methyl-D-erythritol 4-phosphate cytidylyltransferase / 2-C-methyl-D-erythritol 2,4-cyclodiphosphate synthase